MFTEIQFILQNGWTCTEKHTSTLYICIQQSASVDKRRRMRGDAVQRYSEWFVVWQQAENGTGKTQKTSVDRQKYGWCSQPQIVQQSATTERGEGTEGVQRKWDKWVREVRQRPQKVNRQREVWGQGLRQTGMSSSDRTRANGARGEGTRTTRLSALTRRRQKSTDPEPDSQYWPLHADSLRLSQFLFPGFIELSNDLLRFLKKHEQRRVIWIFCSAVDANGLAQKQVAHAVSLVQS